MECEDDDGIDSSVVLCWEGRSKRKRGPPPLSYWEEFVVTDKWYLKEVVKDIPESEMFAALEDSDLGDTDILSEGCDASETDSRDASDAGEEAAGGSASEGESGGEGRDGESESGSVG